MNDWRRLRWHSGRLYSSPIKDFWSIGLDTKDPSIPNLPLNTPAASGITGVLSVTEDSDTVAATGAAQVKGTASSVEADDTAAATGAVLVSGSAPITEGGDTVAGSGAVLVSGAASITGSDDSIVATGAVLVQGSAAANEAGDLVASEGAVPSQGASVIAEVDDLASGLAVVSVAGVGSVSESDDALSAAGGVAGYADTSGADLSSGGYSDVELQKYRSVFSLPDARSQIDAIEQQCDRVEARIALRADKPSWIRASRAVSVEIRGLQRDLDILRRQIESSKVDYIVHKIDDLDRRVHEMQRVLKHRTVLLLLAA